MRRLVWIAAAVTIPQTLAGQSNGSVEAAVNTITPDDIISRIGILAHDSMRGRATPSPELDQVAQWVGEQFRSFGLRPGGDNGTFIQWYPLRMAQFDEEASSIQNEHGASLRFGVDAVLLNGASPPAGAMGRTVLLTGVPSGEDDLTGAGLENANVVWVMPSQPRPGMQEALQELFTLSTASVLMVTPRPDEQWKQMRQQPSAPSLVNDWEDASGPLIVEVRERGVATLLADPTLDLATLRNSSFAVRELDHTQLKVTAVKRMLEQMKAPNTVGILEGSDPALKDEYVVFSAHMDHVGIGRPVNGDSIYNGADDDASGTVAIIELAEAFASMEPRPRRSMIFLTVSGEEKGLWGSDYFARNPPVHTDQLVANLNADMVGRNWPDTIVAIGREHSDLGETLSAVNAAHPELNMTAIDDLWPDENFYFRSDHFNFARRGVPVLFFFNGTHDEYHQPGDEVHLIDAEKASRITKLMFYLGLDIAQRDERPQWEPASYQQIVESSRN